MGTVGGLLDSIVLLIGVAATVPVPDSYLGRFEYGLELCRRDLPAMTEPADEAAGRLAGGGRLWAAGQSLLVNEWVGRAGGIMMIDPLGDKTPEPRDVVLYAGPGAVPDTLHSSGAFVVGIGVRHVSKDAPAFSNHADEAGLPEPLAGIIPGWVFTGELVAALTRLGKMPAMYETIGLPDGVPRIQRLRGRGILFHDDLAIEPVAPGVIGNRFIDAVQAMLRRVQRQHAAHIATAGAWAAEAKRSNRRIFMYSMGHLFPDAIDQSEISSLFESAPWYSGFSQYPLPDHRYAFGDVLIHIGYQHPPYRMLSKARLAGARVIYVDLHCHRDYVGDPYVIWIDPMWPWTDGCVAIDQYDIPILPASGIVNGAIAWEIYRETVRHLDARAPE